MVCRMCTNGGQKGMQGAVNQLDFKI